MSPYSSLSYLKRLPIETLKIDRSFIDELDTNAEDIAIVRAIIALGDALGLSVMAEGVERWSQAGQLQALNCHLAQGYLFGVPLSAHDLGSFPTDDLGSWLPDHRSGIERDQMHHNDPALPPSRATVRPETAVLLSSPRTSS